jgi:C4-dicarboxylate-specific signal transduction histidine kinase
VARPLREQFLLASLVILIPVAAIMTWAGRGSSYDEETEQLTIEARRLASAIAVHIADLPPDRRDPRAIREYLQAIELPDGAEVAVAHPREGQVAFYRRGDEPPTELLSGVAAVAGTPWTVKAGLPSHLAWTRAMSAFQQTLLISGVATLVLLLLQAVFIRRWLPALHRLELSADRVGSGDLTPPPEFRMPSRELEHVQTAFREMVEKLRAARESVESLQQQVIRQERLAAIGVLLSGIAHELNNPLQAISGFSEILQHERDLRPEIRADLKLIQQESARASAIIRNLSRFSRQQSSKPAPVRLGDVVTSVVELRHRRLQEQGIALDVSEAATRPAHAVFTELQQVMLNFLINAEQSVMAAPAGARRIMIRTRDLENGQVHFEVEDTGAGVPPEHESKLFQPFFTTKPVGEGTGLGLSVSYGIVRSFGGTIGYQRGAAGGALFFVDMPASQAA